MKFLSAVLLSLGTARASFVVDLSHKTADSVPSVPTEAPGEESEYPFSEAPFYTTSTFDPKEQGNCNRPEIDTYGYTRWKLEKSFGAENCDDSQNPFKCSLEIDGFKASAEFTYKENTLPKASNPVVGSLVVYDYLTNVGISGAYFVDFFGDCIDSVIVTLESIELYRENPDQVPQPPSDAPMANSFASDAPSVFFPSTFPISVAPSELPPSTFPMENSFASDAPSVFFPSTFPISVAPSELPPSTFPISYFPTGGTDRSFFPSSEAPSGPAMTSRAPDPTAAPTIDCTDLAGEFEYMKKKKMKMISCDKIAGFPHKKRNRFCRKEKTIRGNCPTLCNRKICPCIDVIVPFPLSKRMRNDMKFWTCDEVADLEEKKRKRLCKDKKVIRKSCPSLCDKTCTASE